MEAPEIKLKEYTPKEKRSFAYKYALAKGRISRPAKTLPPVLTQEERADHLALLEALKQNKPDE